MGFSFLLVLEFAVECSQALDVDGNSRAGEISGFAHSFRVRAPESADRALKASDIAW